MSDALIRPADPDSDAAAVAALFTAEYPFILHDERSIAFQMRSTNDRPLRLVADVDGIVAAYATTSLVIDSGRPSSMRAMIMVKPEHRRRGIGAAMLARFEAHWAQVGATNVTARAIDAPVIAVAERHGFTSSRVERISHVALADVPDPLPVPEPYTLRSLIDADERDLFQIDNIVAVDIPSDDGIEPIESFNEWKALYFSPKTAPELTFLAYAGDEPVAVSWLERVGDRVWSSLTGTHPGHRGRGLAKVAKSHSLHRARELGVVDAYTNNDATNAPMLKVNTWLGYRLFTEQRTLVRELA